MRALLALSAAVAALGLAAPATAQDAEAPKVNLLIIYGDDQCPESTDDQINICAQKDEGERFRIPEGLRTSASPQNEAWNNRVLAYQVVGRSGIMSCSPSGAGGSLGCTQQLINASYGEKGEAPEIKFSELIAAERARRMETIDADAADTQARVEALEKAYMERLAKEDAAADAALPLAPLPVPPPQ